LILNDKKQLQPTIIEQLKSTAYIGHKALQGFSVAKKIANLPNLLIIKHKAKFPKKYCKNFSFFLLKSLQE
jgi:hypothetical protein